MTVLRNLPKLTKLDTLGRVCSMFHAKHFKICRYFVCLDGSCSTRAVFEWMSKVITVIPLLVTGSIIAIITPQTLSFSVDKWLLGVTHFLLSFSWQLGQTCCFYITIKIIIILMDEFQLDFQIKNFCSLELFESNLVIYLVDFTVFLLFFSCWGRWSLEGSKRRKWNSHSRWYSSSSWFYSLWWGKENNYIHQDK